MSRKYEGVVATALTWAVLLAGLTALLFCGLR